MKKFFAQLITNILLIFIGAIPQLGRLYSEPIFRFFTGSNYESEWFCNPFWTFIVAWPFISRKEIPFHFCFWV